RRRRRPHRLAGEVQALSHDLRRRRSSRARVGHSRLSKWAAPGCQTQPAPTARAARPQTAAPAAAGPSHGPAAPRAASDSRSAGSAGARPRAPPASPRSLGRSPGAGPGPGPVPPPAPAPPTDWAPHASGRTPGCSRCRPRRPPAPPAAAPAAPTARAPAPLAPVSESALGPTARSLRAVAPSLCRTASRPPSPRPSMPPGEWTFYLARHADILAGVQQSRLDSKGITPLLRDIRGYRALASGESGDIYERGD